MHELSLTENIVEIVRQYVPPERERDVRTIKLRIGELAGVVVDSLEFCFQAITRSTALERATLAVERVPFAVRCGACGAVSPTAFGTTECPACRSDAVRMVSGREMEVSEIELSENEETNA